jgi:DNA invertase Pin-like site-specific DNA recombinase
LHGSVRKNKNIDTILVYSYDRFSRSGTNAAYLSQELQKAGVKVNEVSQQIDKLSFRKITPFFQPVLQLVRFLEGKEKSHPQNLVW